MSDEARLREQICSIAASTFARGLTAGSLGDISARRRGWVYRRRQADEGDAIALGVLRDARHAHRSRRTSPFDAFGGSLAAARHRSGDGRRRAQPRRQYFDVEWKD